MSDNRNPLLTVCLITYNHKQFIRQAIEGVIMQQVDFPFELLIADDFSTDGTRDILVEYQQKHPDLIRLILQEKNVGPAQNWTDLITLPQSKYIAYFEGDDYWIDTHKLRKQVEFMETNAEYSFCFHQALRINEDTSEYDVYPQTAIRSFNEKEFLHLITIPMASLVYRKEVPIQIIKTHSHGDFLMLCSLLTHGKAYFFAEVMSVYRVHNTGVSFHHNSMNYIKRRASELYEEANIAALSLNVRKEIGRVYFENVGYLFERFSDQLTLGEKISYLYKRMLIKKTNRYSVSQSIKDFKMLLFS